MIELETYLVYSLNLIDDFFETVLQQKNLCD